jgi:hypothetical protein
MQITVLYTFDFNETKPYSQLMLEASIITVQRELGNNASIYIYTTMPEKLNFLKYLNINIVKYSPTDFNQKVNNATPDTLSHFKYIGHSRIYIIPHLLKTLQQPVLYMDNDTGIVISKGNELHKYINSARYPVGYCVETWMPLKKLLDLYSDIRLTEDINFEGKILARNNFIINNGLMLFPNTPESYEFTLEQIRVYEYLQQKYKTYFIDMIAFTLLWYNTPYKLTFINPDKKYYVNSTQPPLVIHYYYYKDNFPVIKLLIQSFVTNYKAQGAKNYLKLDLKNIPPKVHWLTNLFYTYNNSDYYLFKTLLEPLE